MQKSPFPITHDHKLDARRAEAHCWAMVRGGWKAKVVHPAGQGWQVVITGFRGF
ncbi:hypothetical protein HWC14_gp51 [Serratia phage Parlo]|uniref:Uncharacterized protein n=1 Tax=Serratia phage Parlo TaxID=2557554 RepID=A0A482MGC9_9CAUD|nr:hypothetical protein HWC14_gp51 [Serratia phage Parlo]QBQ72200.1 hypothetical protein CPT_Parlo_051 [Serratia phage Parlo]